MSTHTPGPWARKDHDDWSVDAPRLGSVALSMAAVGAKKRSYPIALVVQKDRREFGDGDAEHDANLALIAAAPDMLAAMKRLVAASVAYQEAETGEAEQECHDALTAVEAVIAQAEGRAQAEAA